MFEANEMGTIKHQQSEGFLLPKISLPEKIEFNTVGRYTRKHFFTPMEILKPILGKPLTIMQANIRHRSQVSPYLQAFIDSDATDLILAISESVQNNFGVCVDEVVYFAARNIEEVNNERPGNYKKRVAFLYDHALTYEGTKRALKAGVSGIMYDPSAGGRRLISIEENIKLSKRFVDLAKRYKASVELEVGVIPGMDGAIMTEFTEPSAVALLVKAYPDVAVAVSVGNEHNKLSPTNQGLQLKLFERIRKAVPWTPLVLHGGTGVSDIDLKYSMNNLLLDKLNLGTEFLKQVIVEVAKVRRIPTPTQTQLQDLAFCRSLLYYLDAFPQIYLEKVQRAVYLAALTKLSA